MARGEVPSGVSEYVVAVAAAVSAWRAVESMIVAFGGGRQVGSCSLSLLSKNFAL